MIAFLAHAGILERVVERDSPGVPLTMLGIAVPAVTALVLPLFGSFYSGN